MENYEVNPYLVTRTESKDILDDPDNLVTACSGSCNDSQNIFFNPVERDKLMDKILQKRGFIKK